jgi:hypothetical protein
MPKAVKLVGALVALFAAGVLLAGLVVAGGKAQDVTTTATTVETTTTTAPAETETVEHTTTRIVPRTTTSAESPSESAPTWAWVVIAVLAVAAIGLLIALLTRRGGNGRGLSAEERRRRLDGAVAGWVGQGWAIDSESGESAVLRRGGELMLVSVDQNGAISTRPLPPGGP